MADIDVWALGGPIASPAATHRIPIATGSGAGGYSLRSEFVWKGSGVFQADAPVQITAASGNAVLNLIETGVRNWALRSGALATNVFDIADLTSGNSRFSINQNGHVGIGGVNASARLHAKSSGQIARYETTTARGSGNGFMMFADPSGDKGYVGYGGATDKLYIVNAMNADLTFGTNNFERWGITAGGNFYPNTDNTYSMGTSGARIAVVYAATGTINTCDVRFKTFRTDSQLREAEQAAALDLFETFGFFQFNDAIAEKGEDGARWHYGPAAQEAWSVWASHGLADVLIENEIGELVPPEGSIPPAFLCFDLIAEETAPVMEGWRPSTIIDPVTDQPVMVKCAEDEEATEMRPTGETVVTREAGHIFGVRIDQLHSIMIAALNAERKDHATRLTALEAA